MEKEICSLKELRDTMTATRHVNPTLNCAPKLGRHK